MPDSAALRGGAIPKPSNVDRSVHTAGQSTTAKIRVHTWIVIFFAARSALGIICGLSEAAVHVKMWPSSLQRCSACDVCLQVYALMHVHVQTYVFGRTRRCMRMRVPGQAPAVSWRSQTAPSQCLLEVLVLVLELALVMLLAGLGTSASGGGGGGAVLTIYVGVRFFVSRVPAFISHTGQQQNPCCLSLYWTRMLVCF